MNLTILIGETFVCVCVLKLIKSCTIAEASFHSDQNVCVLNSAEEVLVFLDGATMMTTEVHAVVCVQIRFLVIM